MSIKDKVIGWYNRYKNKMQVIDNIAHYAEKRKEKIKNNIELYEKEHKNRKSYSID